MSAHKARRVINQIRGRSYGQALMILELMPYGACYPISPINSFCGGECKSQYGFEQSQFTRW